MGEMFRRRNGTNLVNRKWTVVTNMVITIFLFRIWKWDHHHWKLDFQGLILGSRITQNGVRMQKICLFKVTRYKLKQGWPHVRPIGLLVRPNSARAEKPGRSSAQKQNEKLLFLLKFRSCGARGRSCGLGKIRQSENGCIIWNLSFQNQTSISCKSKPKIV